MILTQILNTKELNLMGKYRKIAKYLDITETEEFEIKNRYANKLLYPSDICDSKYEVVTKYKPMTYLGGDVHFQMQDNSGRYWFAIGDATGHDINSHLLSVMILTQISHLINIYNNPRDINHKINEHLETRLKMEAKAIPFYASLVIMNATEDGFFSHYGQHPNMIIFRSEKNDTEIVKTSGKFIGIDPGIPNNKYEYEYEDKTEEFKLSKDDILFSFTDGIFEQKNKEGKYYGFRLYDFIKKKPKNDLHSFVNKLFEDIHAFADGEINDDLTFMAIRKK
jgi:serine phosphatase RsbU (regulator of sigma subunit)